MGCFGSPAKSDDVTPSTRKSKAKSSDSRGRNKKKPARETPSRPTFTAPPDDSCNRNLPAGTGATFLPSQLTASSSSSSSSSSATSAPREDCRTATSAGSPKAAPPSEMKSALALRNAVACKRLQALKSAKALGSTPRAHPLPCPDSGPLSNASRASATSASRAAVSAPTTPAPCAQRPPSFSELPSILIPSRATAPSPSPSPSPRVRLPRSGSHSSAAPSLEASASASSSSRALFRGLSMPTKRQGESPRGPGAGGMGMSLKPWTEGEGKPNTGIVRSSSCKEASTSGPARRAAMQDCSAAAAVTSQPMQCKEEVGSSTGLPDRILHSSGATQRSFPEAHASHLVSFSYREMAEATQQFSDVCLVGEGGFGPVYQGWVHNTRIKCTGYVAGTSVQRKGYVAVAVKVLKADSHQGQREWLTEVSYLGCLQHPNLVKLLGYCSEGVERMLVYEYMPQGSLEFLLFSPSEPASPSASSPGAADDDDERVLTWHERITVALGIARGLEFLHEEVQPRVIYRDLKTSNILLDECFNAKLTDFGLARDGPQGDFSHVSTRVVGTVGYAAPEYVMTGHLTFKSDIYALGVVLLELLTGRLAMDKRRPKEEQSLVEWIEPFLDNPGKLYKIMDPALTGRYSVKGAQAAAAVAKTCLNRKPKQRPKASAVVQMLEPVLGLFDIAGFVHSVLPSPRGHHPLPLLGLEGVSRVLSGEGREESVEDGGSRLKGVVSPRQVLPSLPVGSARA